MKSCMSCKRLRREAPRFDGATIPGTLRVFCADGAGRYRHVDFPYGDKDTGVIRCDEFEGKETKDGGNNR